MLATRQLMVAIDLQNGLWKPMATVNFLVEMKIKNVAKISLSKKAS